MQIIGGTGNNKPVGVTDDNHLEANARTHGANLAEAVLGNSYNWNSGIVNLTGSSDASGILYHKNTSQDTYICDGFFYILGASAAGTGEMLVEILRNPTAGTTIDGATIKAPSNRDFGSNNTLTGDFFVGAGGAGETLTDGDEWIETILKDGTGRVALPIIAIIPPGASLGIRYTTQANNTSQDVMFAVSMYKKTLEL